MALVTHQIQGPLTTPVRLSPWSKRMKLKQHVETLKLVGKADRCMPLKQKISLSVGTLCRRGSKFKPLRISAFKSNVHNRKSEEGENMSQVPKNSIKLKDGDDSLQNNLKENIVAQSHTSGTIGGITLTPSINKLFKTWLIILRTQRASKEVDGILSGIPLLETSATPEESHYIKRNENTDAVWFYLLNLDAMIKIPLLVFIPLYLTINVFYGVQVSKELMPLWIFGPVIVAFYIKILRLLCVLSILSFNKTACIIKNFPCYYKGACDYVLHGRFSGEVQARVWRPVENIRSLDYEELFRRKFKYIQEWIVEKFLDFVESGWPYYCRTMRFLKRAHLL